MRILIVDHSAINLRILEHILLRENHVCIGVRNAEEALTCLENIPDIHLVITDLDLPQMDGFRLIKALRERIEWVDMPTIVLTGRADPSLIGQAKKLNCEHYVVKPPREEDLIARVREIVGKQPPTLLKREIVLNRYGMDVSLYDELLKELAQELAILIDLLEQSDDNHSDNKIAKMILSIHDGAAALGAERVKYYFSKVQNHDPEEEQNLIIQFKPLFLREFKTLSQAIQLSKSG